MQNNFDNNTMNNIKNLVEKGDISQAISQIPPEMLESFSKMMNNTQNSSNYSPMTNNTYSQKSNSVPYIRNNVKNSNSNYSDGMDNKTNSSNNQNYSNTSNSANTSNSGNYNNWRNFDFSNIDVNTIMKMKSIMENMNNKNDASHNLLYSLKPYLRESKQEKIDQYANLLNISKIAEAFNNNNNQN